MCLGVYARCKRRLERRRNNSNRKKTDFENTRKKPISNGFLFGKRQKKLRSFVVHIMEKKRKKKNGVPAKKKFEKSCFRSFTLVLQVPFSRSVVSKTCVSTPFRFFRICRGTADNSEIFFRGFSSPNFYPRFAASDFPVKNREVPYKRSISESVSEDTSLYIYRLMVHHSLN